MCEVQLNKQNKMASNKKEVLNYTELSDQITCDYIQDSLQNSHETTTVPVDKYNQEINNEETELKCEAPGKSTRSNVTPLDDNDDISIATECHEIVHPEDIPNDELPQIPQNVDEKRYSTLIGDEKHMHVVLKTEPKPNLFRELDHTNIHHPSGEESIHLRKQIQLLEIEKGRLYEEKRDVENSQVSTQKKLNKTRDELEKERKKNFVLTQFEETQTLELKCKNELIAKLQADAEIAKGNKTKEGEKILQLGEEIEKLREKHDLTMTAMSNLEDNLKSCIKELESNNAKLSTNLSHMETKVRHLEGIQETFETTETMKFLSDKLFDRTRRFKDKLVKHYENQTTNTQNNQPSLSFSESGILEDVDTDKSVEKKKCCTETQLDMLINVINVANAFERISSVHGRPWTQERILLYCCDILIDGSNIAYEHGRRKNIGERKSYFSYDGIKLCLDQLQAYGYNVTLVTVPDWRLTEINCSQFDKYEKILKRTKDGPAEDLVVLRKAIETYKNGKIPLIVSNDKYSEFERKSTKDKFPFDFEGTLILRSVKFSFNGDIFNCGLIPENNADKERPKFMFLPRSSCRKESDAFLNASESNNQMPEEQDIPPAAISLKKGEMTKRSVGDDGM